MDIQKLEDRLRRTAALEPLIVRHSRIVRDAADDGPEVGVIRDEMGLTALWYHCEVTAATLKRINEDRSILNAENEFIRKVGP